MILVSGSLAFDHIMDFPGKFSEHILPEKIHMLNVSFLVNEMRKSFGGTAGNIAYSLSLLGVKASILGIAGSDFATYKDFLEKNEVETSHIKMVDSLYTSTAFGITDRGNNNLWGFYTGADKLSENLSINEVSGKIDFGIIAPQNPRAMLKFAREYTGKRIPYLFDPGMQLPWLSGDDLEEAFSGADLIIGNDYEVAVMEKKTGIKDLSELAKRGKTIVITLGEKGSKILSGEGEVSIKPAKVKNTSDPAGAGDAYRAGFVAGYLRKFPLSVCGQMGSAAAAFTVEKFGTTTHHYTLAEFTSRYYENFGERLAL